VLFRYLPIFRISMMADYCIACSNRRVEGLSISCVAVTLTHTMRYTPLPHCRRWRYVYQRRFRVFPLDDKAISSFFCRGSRTATHSVLKLARAQGWRWGSLSVGSGRGEPLHTMLSPGRWPVRPTGSCRCQRKSRRQGPCGFVAIRVWQSRLDAKLGGVDRPFG